MPITSTSLLDSLTDPEPPVPGAAQRAAVDTRAHRMMRRRRLTQGAGALACTVVVGVGVVALVSTADSGSGSGRVEAASSPDTQTSVAVPVVPTTLPATTAPAAEVAPEVVESPSAVTENPAAAVEPEPIAAPLASVSATASDVPPGVILVVTLTGDGGTFTTSTTTGVVGLSDVPPGTYQVSWSWQADDGAQAVGRFTVTLTEGLNSFSF